MKKGIKILFFLWSFMSVVIICILLLFESKRLLNFFSNDYEKSEMIVSQIEDVSSSGRRNGITVSGKLNNENIYIFLRGEERSSFYNYLNDISYNENKNSRELNYDDMSDLNLIVPVVKFKNSKNVLLIPKNKSFDKTIKNWSNKKIIILMIAFFPLILFPIIKKYIL